MGAGDAHAQRRARGSVIGARSYLLSGRAHEGARPLAVSQPMSAIPAFRGAETSQPRTLHTPAR